MSSGPIFLKISTLAAQSSVDSCLISYSEWYTACFLVNAKHEQLNKFDIAGNSRVWILDSNKLIKPVLLPSHWFSRVLLPSGHLPSEDGTVWDCVFNRRHPMAVWAARVSTFRLWTEAVTPGPTTDVFTSEGGTKDRCCWPVSILGLHTNPLLCFLCLLTDFWHQICTLVCGTTSREEHIKPQCSCCLFMQRFYCHFGLNFSMAECDHSAAPTFITFQSSPDLIFDPSRLRTLLVWVKSPELAILHTSFDKDVVQCLHWVFSLQIRESRTADLIPTPSWGCAQVRSYCHGNLSNCNITCSRWKLCSCRIF